MVNVFTTAGALVVGLTISAGVAQGQAPSPVQQVTVVGCVARNGDVDPDKGTRTLDIPPNALALTAARVVATGTRPSSAVPGSQPDGRDSGTIPRATTTNSRPDEPGTLSFELTGASAATLTEYVGRRVELVGRTRLSDTARGDEPRGTSGRSDAAGVPRQNDGGGSGPTGTREERTGATPAHPSAKFEPLEVVSFRAVTGGCD